MRQWLWTLLALLPVGVAVWAVPARAEVIDEYCSRTGDVCLSVQEKRGDIHLRIATPSFRGEYELCVKQVGDQRVCNPFRLSKHGPLYKDRVNWERHFLPTDGRQKATWHYNGTRIGPALEFRWGDKAKRSCNEINLGGPRVFYKQNMRCSTAEHYARRLYKTNGRDEPRNFDCQGTISSGAYCEHDFKNKRFGWHPFDKHRAGGGAEKPQVGCWNKSWPTDPGNPHPQFYVAPRKCAILRRGVDAIAGGDAIGKGLRWRWGNQRATAKGKLYISSAGLHPGRIRLTNPVTRCDRLVFSKVRVRIDVQDAETVRYGFPIYTC
jgi:hypothetical protein